MISLPKKIAQYAFLIIFAFFSIFPLLYMVVAATNKSIDVIRGKMLPGTYLIENYKALVGQTKLWSSMVNSFKYAILLTLLSLVICSLAGYGFEIYHDRGKDALMSVILLAMMVPFVATMIPLFGMMAKFGLLNSVAGFMLPTISTPFLIMLFRQSARSFPHDIIEAARIDGLGEFQIFFRMFFPTMRSTYAAAMTITFMNAWNNYLWPLLVIRSSSKYTLTLGLNTLINPYGDNYSLLIVGSFFSIIPIFILFVCFQQYFIEGMTAGAVKE